MIYNREHFTLAHQRFLLAAKELTDGDLEQLAIIDPTLAERARAKRAGFVEAEDDEDKRLKKAPVSQRDLLLWHRDAVNPILATYRYQLDEAMKCMRDLETRILELEAARLAVVPDVER